ncbi:MAG TPA: hypothetical protein VEL07_00045 [Planctomycetota bacterium]|nr:hypothetical protein [Planctomycetota bacterium]
MRIGLIIRCALIAGWLGLFGWHVVRHAAPTLGLVERHDLGAVLSVQLDRVLTYRLRQNRDSRRSLGECTVWFSRDDTRFRIDHRLILGDLGVLIPGAGGGRAHPVVAGRDIDLALDLIYDDRFRLVEVEGHATLLRPMAIDVTFSGTVDHRGLDLGYDLGDDGGEQRILIADIGRDSGHAAFLVPTLPPGLEVGDRHGVPLIDPQRLIASGGASARSRGVMRAVVREDVATAAGPLRLLRVVFEVDGKHQSTAWCDAEGTVYRATIEALPIVAELTGIRVHGADAIWPPAATPGAAP